MQELLKKILPKSFKKKYKKYLKNKTKKRINKLPLLSEDKFLEICENELEIKKGEILFVHSSVDKLNLDFPFYKIIDLLLEKVGDDGTLIFPTYPKLSSYKFLRSGEIFNTKKTPSYMGILSEFARRHKNAKRSNHPIKSVVAIGAQADSIVSEHHLSIKPYDKHSPFYKSFQKGAKAIGIGINVKYFSAVHIIDDIYPELMPIDPYHKEIFETHIIDQSGKEIPIKTYANDMRKMHFNLVKYFDNNLPNQIARNINLEGQLFFRADIKKTIDFMIKLAKEGKTIYS